jgi:hypothetical protein
MNRNGLILEYIIPLLVVVLSFPTILFIHEFGHLIGATLVGVQLAWAGTLGDGLIGWIIVGSGYTQQQLFIEAISGTLAQIVLSLILVSIIVALKLKGYERSKYFDILFIFTICVGLITLLYVVTGYWI